jgi:hypothetical protein
MYTHQIQKEGKQYKKQKIKRIKYKLAKYSKELVRGKQR